MRFVYGCGDTGTGGKLEARLTPEGAIRITCDRAGERAVSHDLTPAEWDSFVAAVDAAIKPPA